MPEQTLRDQASRCMECGVSFCHDLKGAKGCPVNNQIPDWNDLVFQQNWEAAIDVLHSTNNFPEFTGSLCPAPCEGACVLGINDDPVNIKAVELSIIGRAWEEGWIKPELEDLIKDKNLTFGFDIKKYNLDND